MSQAASRRPTGGPVGTALLALLALAAGCSAPAPLLVVSGPTEFESVEVRDAADAVLWRIDADRPVDLERITYGVVPAGFRQSYPAGGAAPRAFLTGEPIHTETTTTLRVFVHTGYADGPSTFRIAHTAMRLRAAP